jgi:transposase
MVKQYRPWLPYQPHLFPPSPREWLPDTHLVHFLLDVVDPLDLSAIERAIAAKDARGTRPYNPRMMTALLLYGYCVGLASSRKLEQATYSDVAFRVLAGECHPDHAAIAAFRRTHLQALQRLFVEVLRLCQKAGLVTLGHVALDGTKLQANASKHKAMSYARMLKTEAQLEAEMAQLLATAERVDQEEDARYGKGRRGDELPAELARRDSRLRKIREAKAALEREAKEKAAAKAAEAQRKLAERAPAETGQAPSGPAPQAPDPEHAVPEAKAQRNFTDPESRIMPDGANKGAFVQGYNAQIAVDAEAQVIVAAELTQSPNDARQLVPMAQAIVENVGALAATTSADAGYFSAEAVAHPALAATNLLVPPHRQKHGIEPAPGSADPSASAAQRMRHKLMSAEARALYKMRKAIVEPVFGQIKEVRGFRRLLLRGFAAARAEFRLIALTHNLLKLFRSARRPALLPA